jgi:hypothetical protein
MFQPGHVKWDDPYVLSYHPAAIVRCIAFGRPSDGPLLRSLGYRWDASDLFLIGPAPPRLTP